MTCRAPVLLVVALVLASPTAAEEADDKAERLERLRERIDAVKQRLASERSRESELSDELRRLDERVARASRELEAVREQTRSKKQNVADLRQEYDQAAERLAEQRQFLRRQIRQAHRQGREAYLQLLLNQQSPETIDRMMVYYEYFNEARSERIREAVTELQELRAIRDELDREVAELEALQSERATRVERLEADREERQALLARLRERIGDKDDKLAQLRAEEDELSDLVEGLRHLEDIPDGPIDRPEFKALKGEMRWPLDGELMGDYGERRAQGISWQGLLISGNTGHPVRAVAHGRVVFADWLRGMGLLIIIDHGKGYMTLYGHNQSLYGETGDWVSAGDVVATVGASGGLNEPALYFELRSQGQPVDPTAWLASSSPAG